LVEEARHDVRAAQDRLTRHYRWIRDEEVEGNPAQNKKSIRASTTYIKAFGYDRGFYGSKSAR
jgi:hypothetical protein